MITNRLARSKRAACFVIAVTMLAACRPTTGELGSVEPPAPTQQPSLAVPSPEITPGATTGTSSPDASPAGSADPGTTTVRAYYFLGSFTDNAGLAPVLREVPKTQAVGAAAMAALLEGPNDAELGASPAMYTTIPGGTRFLGLEIHDGIATVNLSREFESGGGSASVLGRLAQVVYTLTQFPTVAGVTFELDGEPVSVFSGEGVQLDAPVGRLDYVDQLPAIFVDRPAWGGALEPRARFSGLANTFEATFELRIGGADGLGLAQTSVTATCGTGCWGTFDVTVPYRVSAAQWGTIQVYELSAKDGAIQSLTEYPVWLTP